MLSRSYQLFAPFYDLAIEGWSRAPRAASLAPLRADPPRRILVAGGGSGLDLPHLPASGRVELLDLVPGMLAVARRRARRLGRDGVTFELGDARALPFRDAAFDAVVLHLILAVVPDPEEALAEAVRVTVPGGTLVVFDKFLRPGQRAPLRRWASGLLGRVATRTDVVFEELLGSCPGVRVVEDRPAGARGWFRSIRLVKG